MRTPAALEFLSNFVYSVFGQRSNKFLFLLHLLYVLYSSRKNITSLVSVCITLIKQIKLKINENLLILSGSAMIWLNLFMTIYIVHQHARVKIIMKILKWLEKMFPKRNQNIEYLQASWTLSFFVILGLSGRVRVCGLDGVTCTVSWSFNECSIRS